MAKTKQVFSVPPKAPQLKPYGNRLIVEKVGEAEQERGGIIIPDVAQNVPAVGYVHSAGETGDELLVGQTVLYSKYGGFEYEEGGRKYLLMLPEDILGIY